MKELIESLTIFSKYNVGDYSPTHCEHDILCVVGVAKDEVSAEDAKRLDELGWHWDSDYDCWGSFRFGSA